ncbi:hypothetical protein SASPL_125035 [Salvia splendens]|uniref:DUF7032 domain-containing protein n=1 Tax=Salvia splendens TaxID=180675 RepID=A0A8X8XF72_SALSN|nr:uncharacterized protein LOC121748616 [Salvia splendens]KAG6412358.1 hypothetical protein SASPL_125035 [Salvia splendens]
MKDEEEDTIKSAVTDIQQQLHSLLDSISGVQILKGKWSLITTKLTSLHHRLSDLSTTAANNNNPLSSDLLRSISATCSSAASLSSLCHSPTPPAGKLKTQSDVDSLSAKLDAHTNDLQVIINSGLLAQNADVSSSARRESVRAEIGYLMTRLQIGSAQSKSSALESLIGLLQEDAKNLLIAVAQGIIPVLVRLLDCSSSSELKEKSVSAIAKISTEDSSKHDLLAEGLVLLNNLMRVLESGSVYAKEKSCIVLRVLSNSKENARAIGSRGGISSLLEICREGTPNSQALAARVLRNLAVFEDVRENFVEENSVLILLALCNSGTALAQENAIGCLCNLVAGDDDLKLLVAREGGIQTLKDIWNSVPSAQSLEVVVEMVRAMASCPNIAEFLVADGFLSRLVGILSCGILGVRIAAAKALSHLAYNTKTRKELGEMGCIPHLVSMLDGKAVEEREAAAELLSNLMSYVGNRRIFSKEDRGIVSAVQLLNPSLDTLDKKHVLSILGSLLHSKKCQKQIVAAGASAHLQKLVEADIEGAKKLLDSLGRGKLWGVFNRS